MIPIRRKGSVIDSRGVSPPTKCLVIGVGSPEVNR